MDFTNWEDFDAEIEEVVREILELYPDGDSYLNISPRSGIVESTNGPRHNWPISVSFGTVVEKDVKTGTLKFDFSTIHEMIRNLDRSEENY